MEKKAQNLLEINFSMKRESLYMKHKEALRAKLEFLNEALVSSQHEIVERLLASNDLQEILSQEAITVARAESKSHLVQFLSTLAVHNNIDLERAQHWLDVYQSVSKQQLIGNVSRLSRNNVLRLTIEALKIRKPLKFTEPKKVKGNNLMWIDAIDLSIDHHDWNSARVLIEEFGRSNKETRAWLQISRNISQRHPIFVDQTGLKKADVDYINLAELYYSCANAMKNAGLIDTSNALKILQANSLEMANNGHLAIKILESLRNTATCNTIEVDIARVKCKSGDLLGSIQHLDRAIIRLAGPTEDTVTTAEKFFDGEKKARPGIKKEKFDTDAAKRALKDLMNVANSKNLEVFLVSGTLLGCVREGSFLNHDKDIDVGIIGWENQFDLYSALIKSGLFTYDAQFLKGHETIYLPMLHKSTGIWIDIFVYHQNHNKIYTGVDFFFGYRQTFSFTQFELMKTKFLDIDVLIPKNSELNLQENFGNWKSPDPSYISHLESPSTDDKGSLPFMLTVRLTTYGAIVKKDPIKIGKILTIMDKYQNTPGTMPIEVLEHLSTLKQKFYLENQMQSKLEGVNE